MDFSIDSLIEKHKAMTFPELLAHLKEAKHQRGYHRMMLRLKSATTEEKYAMHEYYDHLEDLLYFFQSQGKQPEKIGEWGLRKLRPIIEALVLKGELHRSYLEKIP